MCLMCTTRLQRLGQFLMISYDQSYDGEFMRLWTVVSELSEHVNQTRSFIASLVGHAAEIKVGIIHLVSCERLKSPFSTRLKRCMRKRALHSGGA